MSTATVSLLLFSLLSLSVAQRHRCKRIPDHGVCADTEGPPDGNKVIGWFYNHATAVCSRPSFLFLSRLYVENLPRCFVICIQRCENFDHSGCGGVIPFVSKKQCMRARCKPVRRLAPVYPVGVLCSREPYHGPCSRNMKRWYYHEQSQKCRQFIWGGCYGSAPFKTLEDCENARCKRRQCLKEPIQASLPITFSRCTMSYTNWYYNRYRDKCSSFNFPGCGPVGPFKSEMECRKAKCGCEFVAEDAIRPLGFCSRSCSSWFFDRSRGKCGMGTYDCCSTIGFDSRTKCQSKCAA